MRDPYRILLFYTLVGYPWRVQTTLHFFTGGRTVWQKVMPASFLHALPGQVGAWGEIWHGGALELRAPSIVSRRLLAGRAARNCAAQPSAEASAPAAVRRRRARLSVFKPAAGGELRLPHACFSLYMLKPPGVTLHSLCMYVGR